jgi:small basic protein
MKKTITLSIAVLSVLTVSAQLPVSKTASKKKALLEDYTGKTCPNCPDGHRISDQTTAANAGNAFSVNIHAGSYASGTPNYKSADGDVLLSGAGVSGYPQATINRGTAQSRGVWASSVAAIVKEDSYVNIAGQATLDSVTGELKVTIEAYYTANAPVSSNNFSVMLLQDNIIGPQSGTSSYPAMVVGSQYRHMHMLRDVITTGATGEAMGTATTSGTTFTKTIKYTVPKSYNSIAVVSKNLRIVALITETKKIITVCKVPISFGSVTSTNDLTTALNAITVYPNPSTGVFKTSFEAVTADNYTIKIHNALGQIVYEEALNNFSGSYSNDLDISSYGKGIYMLSISGSKSVEAKKLIVY